MSTENQILNRLRAALADIPDVVEKRMFGGTAFMVRGKMCVTGRETRIMCRIDPAAQVAALKRPGCTQVVMKGRKYKGYVYVDADAVRSEKELRYWISLALQFNETLVSQ